jgi:hypothetical protein
VTSAVRILAAALVLAAVLASTSSASSRYTFHYVAFVTMTGHGTVQSTPAGIRCPKVCRALYTRGTHLSLRAVAAPGWTFAGFKSEWCSTAGKTCAFDLVSPHDCVGGACPLGAFGVRATFRRTSASG